ncbi:MAG TPA: hypothetical protein VKB49_30045 [Candidatus Sulfotelmatobacter sp.]|nr:hypothetical protein [Candidatus Sulfotelmatobacter sp.]
MLRCSILAIFGLLLPLDAQTTTGRGGSGPSASADQKRDRKQCSAATDDNLMTRLAPHPYVYVAPSIMPAGYALAAIRAEAGLNVESCHSVANARGAYDNGRAANGTDPPNAKGHDRYLDADLYFRLNRLFSGRSFFGVGWRWNQRSTTNWTKTANRPQFGGGYDWIQRPCATCSHDFSMRFEGNWFTAGNDWQNGEHGIEISVSIPNPRETRHWFFLERVELYTYHQTVTDRSNVSLALSQRANRSVTFYASAGIVYRF